MTDRPAAGLVEATQLLATTAIRTGSPAAPRDPTAAGWFATPESCAQTLTGLVERAATASWHAFGGRWPAVVVGQLVLAPGTPGAVGPDGLDGPDGTYRIDEGTVWREVAGHERPLLSRAPAALEPAVELLWFGSYERWTVRHGLLEAEDRLCRLRLPATRERLERLLVRGRRVEAAVLEGLEAPALQAATVEVRRAAVLVGRSWRDPEKVLAARVGVVSATTRGARVQVELEDGPPATFDVREAGAGWWAERRAGAGPFSALGLSLEGEHVVARAELDPELDPLAPGVRGRLAFDLASDLVVVAR